MRGCSSSYPDVAVPACPLALTRLLRLAAPRSASPDLLPAPSPRHRRVPWAGAGAPAHPRLPFSVPARCLQVCPASPRPPPKARGKPISHVRFGLVLSTSFSSEEESSSSSSSSAEGSASAREETAQLNIRARTLPEQGQSGPGASWAGGTRLCPVGRPGQGSADAQWGGAGIPGERCACPPAQPGLTVPAIPVLWTSCSSLPPG